ncbi:MAG: PKD domain-containing protein [Thermoplasmata archaeon]|nr:MAG: PKD domain-containing protein [Thermoplasmata archaeon]
MVVKNCIRIAIMVILLASMLPSSIIMVKGDNTIYVDDDGDGDFTTIQAAINAANNGDTIYIKNGIYNGGISINKIVYIVGESKNAIVDCGNNYGFQIWSSGTEINGITIKNAGEGYAGIIVYAEATIKNCNFSYNYEAIHVVGSENGLIMRNVFYNNYYGITFVNSYFNVVRENYFIKNQKAISLGTDTSDNIFCYNNFMSNIVDVDDESGLNFWDYEYVGNYWDRYNGIDSDGDGIGDTPYKIDEAKGIMDHYPLMQNYTGIDIFPPDIMNLCANPVIQEPNGNVNITCKIVDNVGVNVAFVNITFPNGSYINKSLNQIGNSSYYYFNRSYSLKGIYYYHVWANDTNNNSVKTKLHKFVIAYAPHVSFNYTPTQPTDLDTVNFISNSRDSDGVIVNYTWSIYDPILKKTIARFYTSNFSYTFPDNGNYEVTLTVTDNDGAWNTTTKEINVANIPPVANFTWQLLPPFYPTQPYVGQHIKFYSQSYDVDGEIRVYKWYFGDGNSVITGENYTIYSYSVNGVFNITLVVTDNDYGEATITKSIAVYDIFPPSIKNLTAYPNPQEAGNYINISCKIYEDVGVKYAWLIIQYPNGSILNVTMNALGNTYFYNFHCEEPGNYSYYVDTSDINGNKNSSSLNYFNVIVPPSPPSITNVSVTPNWQVEYGEDANITCHVVDNVGVASVVIDLNGNKSMNGITDGRGNGIYYYILHFPSIGNYSFKIYATDINGYVNSTHYFNFTVADTMAPSVEGLSYKTYMVPGWQNISCNISDPSGVYEARINITYPDGSYVNESMQKSGTYYYNIFCNATGKYYFYIWTQDAIGNAGKSMLYNFSVTTPPVANFTWQPLKPYSHELITFNANSSYDEDGYIVLYKWDWDNDGIYDISTTSPVITYSWNKSGTYAVTLTVVDNAYAETNITKYISIRNIPPIANFSWQPLYPDANESIIFNANSSYDSDGDIVNYTWQFGDGSTGYGMIVNHSYTAYGEYNVTLVVTDDDGAIATVEKSMVVWMVWDVNMDGRANVLDLIAIAQHWNEHGEPAWIRADTNHDGIINVLDLIVVAIHWTG